MNTKSQRAKNIAIIQIVAAVSLLVSFFLPWYTFSSYDNSVTLVYVNVSWMTTVPDFTKSGWAMVLPHLLITLGAIVVIVLALIILIRSRRSVVLSALTLTSFATVAVGALWSTLNVTVGEQSWTTYFGLWIFIAAAIIGALAVIFDLVASNVVPVSISTPAPYPTSPTYYGTDSYSAPVVPWQQSTGHHADSPRQTPQGLDYLDFSDHGFCTKCGALRLVPNQIFCSRCGYKQPRTMEVIIAEDDSPSKPFLIFLTIAVIVTALCSAFFIWNVPPSSSSINSQNLNPTLSATPTSPAGIISPTATSSMVNTTPSYPAFVTSQRVYDEAGIFDPRIITAVEESISAFEARTGTQIIVYTQIRPQSNTPDLAKADAIALMEQWNVGGKGVNNSVIILFDVQPNLEYSGFSLYTGPGFPWHESISETPEQFKLDFQTAVDNTIKLYLIPPAPGYATALIAVIGLVNEAAGYPVK